MDWPQKTQHLMICDNLWLWHVISAFSNLHSLSHALVWRILWSLMAKPSQLQVFSSVIIIIIYFCIYRLNFFSGFMFIPFVHSPFLLLQNELAILEFIHLLVETMDRHFGNVVSLLLAKRIYRFIDRCIKVIFSTSPIAWTFGRVSD